MEVSLIFSLAIGTSYITYTKVMGQLVPELSKVIRSTPQTNFSSIYKCYVLFQLWFI